LPFFQKMSIKSISTFPHFHIFTLFLMVNSQYIFKGRGLEPKISGFVRGYFASAYESTYKGGFVRVYEDSSYFSKRNYIVMIRVDTTEAEEGIIRVEAIAAGGDEIVRGDSSRSKTFARAIQDFCKEHFISYDVV
jgi:hypothetical protein